MSLAEAESGPSPVPARTEPDATRRPVRFNGEWHDSHVLRGEPSGSTTLHGPAVWELPETTLVLPPGWTAHVDDYGTVVVETDA